MSFILAYLTGSTYYTWWIIQLLMSPVYWDGIFHSTLNSISLTVHVDVVIEDQVINKDDIREIANKFYTDLGMPVDLVKYSVDLLATEDYNYWDYPHLPLYQQMRRTLDTLQVHPDYLDLIRLLKRVRPEELEVKLNRINIEDLYKSWTTPRGK